MSLCGALYSFIFYTNLWYFLLQLHDLADLFLQIVKSKKWQLHKKAKKCNFWGEKQILWPAIKVGENHHHNTMIIQLISKTVIKQVSVVC